MKKPTIHLFKYQIKQLEKEGRVEICYCGLYGYAELSEYGDFETPNGYRFEIEFYSLNSATANVQCKE